MALDPLSNTIASFDPHHQEHLGYHPNSSAGHVSCNHQEPYRSDRQSNSDPPVRVGVSMQANCSTQESSSVQIEATEGNNQGPRVVVTTHGAPPTPGDTESQVMYPGSAIDRAWRRSMMTFILGALPQAIKVFGMRGIPITQTIIAILLTAFIVPEWFRWMAGTAGQIDLQPMPIVLRAKKRIAKAQDVVLFVTCAVTVLQGLFIVAFFSSDLVPISCAIALASAITIVVLRIGHVFARLQHYKRHSDITEYTSSIAVKLQNIYLKLLTSVSNVFAVRLADIGAGAWLDSKCVVLFTFILSAICLSFVKTDWTWKLFSVIPRDHIWDAPHSMFYTIIQIAALSSVPFIPIPAILILHLIYRLLFIGSLSKYPRALLGLNGCAIQP
ncbi:hypothetical protein BKA66DRAFT_610171 [Pyrenochaeta sp. MPI-SDFR-AT-0127]|nr:hypothetical protein BKA66DRAFT_610171 [Pyrenochaeta sp. MPI-SDFR-AT-0127]